MVLEALRTWNRSANTDLRMVLARQICTEWCLTRMISIRGTDHISVLIGDRIAVGAEAGVHREGPSTEADHQNGDTEMPPDINIKAGIDIELKWWDERVH